MPLLAEVERACARFTPRIERHQDTLVLDLHGCQQLLLGGHFPTARADVVETAEELEWPVLAKALGQQLRGTLPAAATPLRVGIGPSRTVAWLAATVADPLHRAWRAVPPSGVAAFLAPLPLDVLRAVPDLAGWIEVESVCAALGQAGIRRVEQVLRLPTLALERRFAAAGIALAHVAAGRDLLPFHATVPAAWRGARRRFPTAVDAEQVGAALAPLAERLARILAERHLSACAVAITVTPEHGAPLRTLRHLHHPVASADALLTQTQRLLASLIVTPTPPASGTPMLSERQPRVRQDEAYVAIRLRVGALGPATSTQPLIWNDDAAFTFRLRQARLLTLLHAQPARAGWQHHASLLRAVAHDPDAVLPEDRYRLMPWELP